MPTQELWSVGEEWCLHQLLWIWSQQKWLLMLWLSNVKKKKNTSSQACWENYSETLQCLFVCVGEASHSAVSHSHTPKWEKKFAYFLAFSFLFPEINQCAPSRHKSFGVPPPLSYYWLAKDLKELPGLACMQWHSIIFTSLQRVKVKQRLLCASHKHRDKSRKRLPAKDCSETPLNSLNAFETRWEGCSGLARR